MPHYRHVAGSRHARLPLTALVGLLGLASLVAGCAGAGSTGEGASTAPAAATSAAFPGWPTGPDPDAEMVPIIVSKERVVGPNRFTYALVDAANRPIAAPDLATTVRFFDLAADPATPVGESPGTFIWTVPDELGLYHARADFERAGPWGVEITATAAGQPARTARAMFDVQEVGTTPSLGAAAPASDTPTATDAAGIALISTDPQPAPAFYRTSVKEALASGRPFVLVFATPLFCSSRTCGPTLDTVKQAVAGEEGRIEVIHVEPYRLTASDGQLQPVRDANGGFQVVPSAEEWGIPVEPYTFVVGADGRVAAKFESAFGVDELRAAIDDVVGAGAP